MKFTKLFILNAPILTNFGAFEFKPLALDQARALVAEARAAGVEIVSAVGHQSTAELLTFLLKHEIQFNRITIQQEKSHAALVFKLKTRIPEGKILSLAELLNLDFQFGLLERTA